MIMQPGETYDETALRVHALDAASASTGGQYLTDEQMESRSNRLLKWLKAGSTSQARAVRASSAASSSTRARSTRQRRTQGEASTTASASGATAGQTRQRRQRKPAGTTAAAAE